MTDDKPWLLPTGQTIWHAGEPLDPEKRIYADAKQIAQLKTDLAKENKGHKLYKRLFEKNAKFLRTTLERLESSSWENEQELRISLNRWGGHQGHCAAWSTEMNSPGVVGKYINESKCDCGWRDEKAVLALLDKFSEEESDDKSK